MMYGDKQSVPSSVVSCSGGAVNSVWGCVGWDTAGSAGGGQSPSPAHPGDG